jgi:hypothetical protein
MPEFDSESTSGTKELQKPVAVVDHDVVWRVERNVEYREIASDT